MLDESALAIVRALANGLDPATGAALPPDHACQRPDTVRALCAALSALETRRNPNGARRTVAGAPKSGSPWDEAEDEALVAAFARGESYADIAQRHERTRTAIEARLVRLGKIEVPPGLRLRESHTGAR
jgi:hypothetical protein